MKYHEVSSEKVHVTKSLKYSCEQLNSKEAKTEYVHAIIM